MEAGHSLAPTSSSINFLAWGDSLSIACMKRKKWTNKKFVATHPSGTLATAMILVNEIMATGKDIPLVNDNTSVKEAVIEMSKKNLGTVCVKEKNGKINLADIFAKLVDRATLERLRPAVMGRQDPPTLESVEEVALFYFFLVMIIFLV